MQYAESPNRPRCQGKTSMGHIAHGHSECKGDLVSCRPQGLCWQALMLRGAPGLVTFCSLLFLNKMIFLQSRPD